MKLEIADVAGGSAFWDVAGSASFVGNAILTHRDPAGSRWAVVTRAESGVAANRTNLFTDLIPSQRSTGSGDAVNDGARPSLGASGSEWTNVYGTNIYGNLTASTTNTKKVQPDADVTWDLGDATRNYNALYAKYVEMSSGGYIAPQTTNTSSIGRSGFPFNKGWFTDIVATGTVQLKASSTIGQVWTATGTDGSGDWAAPGISQWTTSGSNIHYSSGNVGINQSSPQGRLAIGNFTVFNALDGGSASTDITDNLRFDGTNWRLLNTGPGAVFQLTAGDLKLYTAPSGSSGATATLTQRLNFSQSGSLCVGCTGTSFTTEVNGTFRATGAATFGNTSTFAGAVAVGSTDLTTATLFSRAADVNGLRIHNSGTPSPSGGAGIQAAIETAPASGDRLAFYAFGLRTGGSNYNGANITAFATQNWTPGSAQGTELRFETTANGAASRNTSLTVRSGGIDVTGQVNVVGNYAISGAQVVDSSRNLVNIVDLTNTGNINSTGYVSGGSMRIGATAFINSSLELVNIVKLNAVSATVINYLANITSDVQFQFAQRGELGANNTWTQNNTFNGLTTFGGSVSAQATVTTYDIVPAATNTYSNSTGSRYWLNTYTQYLTVGTGLTYPSGAVNGYCLKTDGSGNATWNPCASGVTSIATSSPISGGTITTTGTISCPTCFTTSGGTITGAVTIGSGNLTIEGLRFSTGSFYTIGTSGARASNIFTENLQVYSGGELKSGATFNNLSGSTVDFSGTVTTGGSATATATYSCGAGEAIKTLTVSRGLVTAATCGTP
jgi:hypothetical protein